MKFIVNFDGTLVEHSCTTGQLVEFLDPSSGSSGMSWASFVDATAGRARKLTDSLRIYEKLGDLREDAASGDIPEQFVWDGSLGGLPRSIHLVTLSQQAVAGLTAALCASEGGDLPSNESWEAELRGPDSTTVDISKGVPMFDRDQPTRDAQRALLAYREALLAYRKELRRQKEAAALASALPQAPLTPPETIDF